MKKSRAVLFLFVLILIHTFPLFAANNATAERYMTSANEQYSLENFSKAYTYINYVLEQYDEKTVTLNVKLLAELIYYDYLGEIEKKNDLAAFREYQDSVNDFPYIVSDRIQKKLDSLVPVFQKIAADEEARKKAAQQQQQATQQQSTSSQRTQTTTVQSSAETIAAIQASNDTLSKKIQDSSNQQLIITQETQALVQQIREEFSRSTQEIRKETENNQSRTRLLVIILIGVVLLMITIIVSIIVIVLRMSRRQKELFTTTLRIVSEIKKLPLEISNSTNLRIEDNTTS